jgi:superfamily II DNA or RNA helicase
VTWETGQGQIWKAIEKHGRAALDAYAADPNLVEEHVGQERETKTGGYGRRQLFELVQNGADQLTKGEGRIQVVLTDSGLYCANAGKPFAAGGVTSILHAYLSRKDDEQIGRFGLGFKSVLGVTSSPMVLSRSGSFRFGLDVAERIRTIVPDAEDVPLLRIADPLDPTAELKADEVVAELAEWASTIIVLPFDEPDSAPWLASDITKFPQAFLAFADHVESLELQNRVTGERREISAKRCKGAVTIAEGATGTQWFLFEDDVSLSAQARKRAGKLAERDDVTVKWAVQPEGSRDLGSFWSYFPTDDETTLRGVLNAPWQLSEDRRRLVDGPYNEAVLEGAVELIISSLELLRSRQKDPTSFLEILPGRGKEPRCWADGVLTDKTNDALAYRESIPLLDGELEIPVRARLHPSDLPREALEAWSSVADPGNWVHHAVDLQKDRRARVVRYIEDAHGKPAEIEEWLEAVTCEATPERGVAAARIAGALIGTEHEAAVREASPVLTTDLSWKPLDAPNLVLPGEFQSPDPDTVLVHESVAADEVAAKALQNYGLERINVEVELRRLTAHDEPSSDSDWEEFWSVARQVPTDRAHAIMKDSTYPPRVKTLDGSFKSVRVTLFPGRCVPRDGSRDASLTIDETWHQKEISLLQLLGCVDGPRPGAATSTEPWYPEYEAEAKEAFEVRNKPAKVSRELIELSKDSKVPGPLSAMRALSEEGRAALVAVALECSNGLGPWTVAHSSQNKYESVKFPNPAVWLIQREGLLQTPLGPRSPGDCVGPELLAGELSPAPSCRPGTARALGLPETWSEVPEELIAEIQQSALEAHPEEAGLLYRSFLGDEALEAPEFLRCTKGGAPAVAATEAIAVVVGSEEAELLSSSGEPLIEVGTDEERDRFVERWGLTDASTLISRRVAVAAMTDPVLLIDEFPPLKRSLTPQDLHLELQRCDEIRIIEEVVGGTRSEDVLFARDELRLYCDAGMSAPILLLEVSRELGLGLTREDADRIIRGAEDRKAKDLAKKARKAKTDSERLLALLGPEVLRSRLPKAAVDAYVSLYGEPTDTHIADLARSVHGVDLLRVHAEDFEERNLHTPGSWGGSPAAKEFVRSFGFPLELAGFESEKRPRELVVEGRPKMPALHSYQADIVAEMQKLFDNQKTNRAMLTLPTGAGKTRVAIEGAIRAIRDGSLSSDLVLWIAQSDELCEQAVQSWGELWRASEIEDRLTISRLWASNPADPAPSGVQVVVATIHKLQNVIDVSEYEWLREPGLVVIDEAHTSIGPMYTNALDWLGLEHSKYSRPLLGLSATPYRGRNKVETDRLAKRYGQRRLDAEVLGSGDHYPQLQEMGVISRVKHKTLEGGTIVLDDAKHEDVKSTGLLPKAADTELGKDVERTQRVVESIRELPEDWPVLVFAPSVENAQALAGLLNHAGVSAASISGETPSAARRWYIREFREKRLRVITNYQVLAEGFDAPSVRAVYVARPVFAPNRYQQMVGRGLRGPLNGGKEECLIVDVEDNIENFDFELAFNEFEYLWDPSVSPKVATPA